MVPQAQLRPLEGGCGASGLGGGGAVLDGAQQAFQAGTFFFQTPRGLGGHKARQFQKKSARVLEEEPITFFVITHNQKTP